MKFVTFCIVFWVPPHSCSFYCDFSLLILLPGKNAKMLAVGPVLWKHLLNKLSANLLLLAFQEQVSLPLCVAVCGEQLALTAGWRSTEGRLKQRELTVDAQSPNCQKVKNRAPQPFSSCQRRHRDMSQGVLSFCLVSATQRYFKIHPCCPFMFKCLDLPIL